MRVMYERLVNIEDKYRRQVDEKWMLKKYFV